MSASRIEAAMTRINSAMARIDAARASQTSSDLPPKPHDGEETHANPDGKSNSARVMALVNAHEKLREEVADTLGELDALIEELEG